ncbi:hypothetical protein [Vibrio spartinae]|uniref:Uncharacterized protein n=1 Tax=Vibrio spartinae TaxID=1918945 RepID=A0A1N6M9X9_9VIBR|nr:hypothetical protein [Vibrio spartinae]QMV15961.1 hypothetical protein Vspart_03335 [Vibrio spartinae]SIO96203.1 hypothetical protein VSP9026_03985 [Vibrio spartinae]
MNSYQENLQEVVGTSLDALYAQQQKLASQRRGAQYSLYYAQGAQLTAFDNLESTSEQLEAVRLSNQQGVKNDNLMNNLVESTHLIQSNVATTVSNSATAATNVQTAATAVAKLAGDIGSALNIAAAACYGTDIYKKTLEANAFIRETANQAEYASQKAMEASSSSSEVIAKELESSATRSKSELEKLLAAAQTQFKSLSSARVADQEALFTASQTEKKAEGALEDAQSAESAIDGTVQDSNDTLNFNLTAVAQGDQQITVSFQPFTSAFTQLPEQCATQLGKTDGSTLRDPAQHYFVFVVSADKKSSIKQDQVESTFAEYQKDRFTEVTPDDQGHYQTTLKYGDSCLDFSGKPLQLGRDYLVYMYVVLDLTYQKYIGSYSNVLSSASPAVTLLTKLPVAQKISFDDDSRQILFMVTGSKGKYEPEFRVMLLPAYQPSTGGLMVAPLPPEAGCSALNFYFNQSIAMQVSSANYQLAHIESSKVKSGKRVHRMAAAVPDDMTDNFGNPLIAGASYIPVVLTTPASGVDQGCYASSLSALDTDPVIIIPSEDHLGQLQPSASTAQVTDKDDSEEKKTRRSAKKNEADDEQE